MRLARTCLPVLILLLVPAAVLGAPCELPDNGSGTVDLPPQCPDGYTGSMRIVDGLPPGTTIEIEARWTDFTGIVRTPGGTLGGEIQQFDAGLEWHLTGTGDLTGFSRTIQLQPQCEVHTAPRTPGEPVQTFAGDIMSMQAVLYGDPDFCELSITAGSGFGLPGPGQTILTELSDGNFNVDSFFDITYRIDFAGCPGSLLEGLAGSTVDVDRFQAGRTYTAASCVLPDNGDGTIDLPPTCPDGYQGDMRISAGLPAGSVLELATTLTDFFDIVRVPDNTCILPDNGSGTADLPPDCPDGYLGNLTIVDGLPPGTTLAGDAVLSDFSGVQRTSTVSCPLPDNGAGTVDLPPECPDGYRGHLNIVDGLPPGTVLDMEATLTDLSVTRYPGGSLGGEVEAFSAALQCRVTGSGDLTGFTRTLSIPVEGEIHHGPRNPGDPEQVMAASIHDLHGELFGDPDFCTLRVNMGATFSLPCPGQTTLTRLPDGDFAVDSFFDITYRIEFEGCPGSPLQDFMGATTDTDRLQAGEPFAGIGEIQNFDATIQWSVSGTGSLAGYGRTLSIPVSVETRTGPRVPGDPVQTFGASLLSLQGELFGDPDFCTLRIAAGDDNGLPGPGQTSLTRLPDGDFAVDSFFDVTYRIEFEGCPGSPIEGFMGATTGTERFQGGEAFSGGEFQEFDATLLWQVTGTGDLAGFTRSLSVPVHCRTHADMVPAGDPLQVFDHDLVFLQGELFGDPDFCTLRVRAGAEIGLPSPGVTRLNELPSGDYAVDSFFDITYEIDFEGCPGSLLMDMAGTTAAGTRLQAGDPDLTSAPGSPSELPRTGLALHPNRPNPFNPSTVIGYEVPAGGARVRLEVFDIRGRLVRTLVDERQAAGPRQVLWDGADGSGRRVPSGVYFSVLRTDVDVLTRKMAVIK